jgi:hypothetical protein
MRRVVLSGVLAVAVLGFVPASAATTHVATTAKTPKPPLSGAWKLTNQSEVACGTFTVARKHANVSGLRLTVGPVVEASCGPGSIAVLGTHKITDARGDGKYAGRYNFWIVGRNTPKAINMFSPVKVTLGQAGKHFAGRLELTFVGQRGGKTHTAGGLYSGGELFYHRTCELSFSFSRR